jgi:hypothetical protein
MQFVIDFQRDVRSASLNVARFWPTGAGGTLSRRDMRTQPGVSTSGNDRKIARPERAEEILSAFRSLTRGLVKVLWRSFGADPFWVGYPRLKPRAESCSPFGTKILRPSSI